jgi:hypothetical protein
MPCGISGELDTSSFGKKYANVALDMTNMIPCARVTLVSPEKKT